MRSSTTLLVLPLRPHDIAPIQQLLPNAAHDATPESGELVGGGRRAHLLDVGRPVPGASCAARLRHYWQGT
eukprot:1425938-Pyramimonas_sp.AAC.1